MNREFLIYGLTFLALDLLIYWLISDPRTSQQRVNSYKKPKSILIGLFILSFFILNFLSGMYFPLPYSGFDELLTLLGLLTFLTGSAIALWAKITMGKIWGVPAQMRKDQNKLVKHGPFKYSRNPIYLGLIMVLIGYGLALQSYFTFLALIPIFYFWDFAQKEEQLLEKNFGKEYLKYKKEVPRFF